MFVIYEKSTTRLVPVGLAKTERAAKAIFTRHKLSSEQYAIAELSYFQEHIEVQVERRNLMSGDTYMEPINTPPYMSPACESYWSM